MVSLYVIFHRYGEFVQYVSYLFGFPLEKMDLPIDVIQRARSLVAQHLHDAYDLARLHPAINGEDDSPRDDGGASTQQDHPGHLELTERPSTLRRP